MEKYFKGIGNLEDGIWAALDDGYTAEDISRYLDKKVAEIAEDHKEDWATELEMAREDLLDAMTSHLSILTGKEPTEAEQEWAKKMLLDMEKAVTAPKKNKTTKENKNRDEELLRAFLNDIL